MTTSARARQSRPLRVSSPGSPGPAPTRYTVPGIAVPLRRAYRASIVALAGGGVRRGVVSHGDALAGGEAAGRAEVAQVAGHVEGRRLRLAQELQRGVRAQLVEQRGGGQELAHL